MDREMLQEFLERVSDKFTASELCDLLEIDIWSFIAAFENEIIEGRELLEI